MKKVFLLTAFIFTTFISNTVYGQVTISGEVIDSTTSEPIMYSNIYIPESNIQISSDADGRFWVEITAQSKTLVISHIGYHDKKLEISKIKDKSNLVVVLVPKNELLRDVVIKGTNNRGLRYHKAVNVSTVNKNQIEQVIGAKQLPELLNYTPSVYATKAGGGRGDARINIRGFDQSNIGVMVNGIPMNDMETSWVYWSNFSGIENVTSQIEIQRGLGLTNSSNSSVAGTINIVTNSSLQKKGGKIQFGIGNDNFLKSNVSYNSGLMKNGLSYSLSLGLESGDGYVEGTEFNIYNYFFSLGWKNKTDRLELSVLGSPQNHGQRVNSHHNMATLEQHLKYGLKYNYNHGYLNGKSYNWTENYFHKPIVSLFWKKNFTDRLHLNTNVYAAFGRGGGTFDLGRLPGNAKFASSPIFRDENGLFRFDDLVAYNTGKEVVFSDGKTYKRDDADENGEYINGFIGKGLTRRAFTNSHQWYGAVTDLKYKLGKYAKVGIGADFRYTKGINYIRISNLFGAKSYYDFFNKNNPNHYATKQYETSALSVLNVFRDTDEDEKIFFHVEGLVKWIGTFGYFSYDNSKFSAFVQTAISNKSYQRRDYFGYQNDDPNRYSDWISVLGGYAKTGISYKLFDVHKVYFNAGYFSNQPGFNVIFLENNNDINQKYNNEKTISTELGYEYKAEKFDIKANFYLTDWSNRFVKYKYKAKDTLGVAKILDLGQLHKGFELEGGYRPIEKFSLRAMFSIGDWRYKNDVTGKLYDDKGDYLNKDIELKLKEVKVPDAAQLTSRISANYEVVKGLDLGISYFYANDLYAAISPKDNWKNHDTEVKLPAFNLFDASISYKFKTSFVRGLRVSMFVDNLFDTTYISESATNYEKSKNEEENWNGVNKANKVFFGFGRTWKMSLSVSF